MKLRHFFEKIDDMEMGDVIKDFYKSDAPQFKGKSKKKRRQMAIAAKLSANENFVLDNLTSTVTDMSPEQAREVLLNLGMTPEQINDVINQGIKIGWENVKADPVGFANMLRQQNPQVFYALAGVLGLAAVGGGFIVAKVGQGLKKLFTGKKSKENESLQALARHVKEGVPLPDSLFRYQSEAYFDTFKQAKQLREMGSLPELDWESEEMLSTDIGESFELENGETVWLDVPYLDESEMPDLNDEMIGVPDDFYDEEERREAFVDLQDALTGGWEDQYIVDGICPNCAGTGYSDAEDEIYNDETDEYEEGLECDGWGPFGCDQGEMTGATWKEILAFDQQNVDRQKAKDNYPGDEEVIQQIANMVQNMEDPRQVYRQMQVDFPHMGRAQRSNLIAQGMKKAGLTSESIKEFNENEGSELQQAYDRVYAMTDMPRSNNPEIGMGDDALDQMERYAPKFSDALEKYGDIETIEQKDSANVQEYIQELDYVLFQMEESIDLNRMRNLAGIKEDLTYLDRGLYRGQKVNSELQRVLGTMLGIDDFYKITIKDLEDQLNPDEQGKPEYKTLWKEYLKYKEMQLQKVVDKQPAYDLSMSPYESLGENEFDVDNEEVIAKILGKELQRRDWKEYTPYELYAELESVDPDKADFIKDLAKLVYGIRLQEGFVDDHKAKLMALGLAGSLATGTGLILDTSAKTSPLGLELYAAAQQGDEVAKYHYKRLDLYADADDRRTLINLRIHYLDDSPRDDVRIRLATQAGKSEDYKTVQDTGRTVTRDESVKEAEYKGKKVKLNKPTRQSGGGKKYKVYVKNPKTGRVKKISFGDAGLKTKSGNKKRAKSFAARHNCEKKNDKMKAGYWACRLPRYGLVKGGKWW